MRALEPVHIYQYIDKREAKQESLDKPKRRAQGA